MVGAVASSASSNTSVSNHSSKSSGTESVSGRFKERLGQITSQYSKVSFSVSPDFLKKMETDPAAAAKGQEILDGIPAAAEWYRSMLRQNGIELVSGGVMIDADGNMSSWSVTTRTSSSSGPSSDVEKTSKDKKDDWLYKRHVGDRKGTVMASVESLLSRVLSDKSDEAKAAAADSTGSPDKVDILA